jgi:ribosomal protein S18 acetylase RimI-like enzyme
MEERQLILRPARPEFEEGIVFAQYLDAAADGLFRLMIGKAVDRVVATAFLEPGNDLSYEHVVFAEEDTTIIGMVSSYSSQEHRQSTEDALIQAAGWRAVRMGVVNALAAGIFRFLGTIPDDDFYLQAVAVAPGNRGSGVGSALIRHAEQRGRGAGCIRIALDVAVDNDGAQRLYERLGFAKEATSPRSAFLPGSQIHRMVKVL